MRAERSQTEWRTTEVHKLRAMAGQCALKVARELGRTPCAVQDKARRIRVATPVMPKANNWPQSTKDRALRLRTDGKTLTQIARSTGVPFGTIRHWIYDNKGNP